MGDHSRLKARLLSIKPTKCLKARLPSFTQHLKDRLPFISKHKTVLEPFLPVGVQEAIHSRFGFVADQDPSYLMSGDCADLRLGRQGSPKIVFVDNWTSFEEVHAPFGIYSVLLPDSDSALSLFPNLDVRFVVTTQVQVDALNPALAGKLETGYLYDAGEDCPYYAPLDRIAPKGWRRCEQDTCLWFIPVPSDILQRVVSKCTHSPSLLHGGFDTPQLHLHPGNVNVWQGISSCRVDVRLQRTQMVTLQVVAQNGMSISISCLNLGGDELAALSVHRRLQLGELRTQLVDNQACTGRAEFLLPDGTILPESADDTPIDELLELSSEASPISYR